MASSPSDIGLAPPAVPSDGAAGEYRAQRLVGTVGAAVGALVTVAMPMLAFRPNRVVDGIAMTAVDAFGATGWIVAALWVIAGIAALTRPTGVALMVRAASGPAALMLTLGASGAAATRFADSAQSAAARTSLGAGFYLTMLALFLTSYAASAATDSHMLRVAIVVVPLAGVIALGASGSLSDLGIVREFMLARSAFLREVRRHLFYALGSTITAIALGVPLGVVSARRPRVETVVMGSLNLGQVFPALAFVGLLMPVLGGLGDRFTVLKALGISGIGWAPVFVVLLVYALYPITRNTLVAIRQLDAAVLDSAKGMGMGRWRLLSEVELPLAFPVVLAGIRVALVQSTAGAIIAAFVGGGGLGTIMFFGLEQTSMDLVLVGVLPIIALALTFDAVLRSVERIAGRWVVATA